MPRRKRQPYHDKIAINPETFDAYAIADKYVPLYHRKWLVHIRMISALTADVVRETLGAYYEVAPAMTAVALSQVLRQAWRDMAEDLRDVLADVWADSADDARVGSVAPVAKKAEPIEYFAKPELMAEALEYAETESGKLIVGEAGNTKSIQKIVSQGVQDGRHPRLIAKEIQELGIGLPERGPYTTGRVDRYRQAQIDKGVKGKKLEARVARFHAKMVKERARLVALTETAAAQGTARRRMWAKERGVGLINSDAERIWMAGSGENRTCSACVDMDGLPAPVGGTYPNGVEGPPLHPRCRCTEGLRIKMD